MLVCFQYLIPEYHQLLVYPIWLVNFDSLFQPHQSLSLAHAEKKKNRSERVKPSCTHILTFYFVILIQETVFLQVDRLCGIREMLTGSPLLSSRYLSLARFFTARLHFSLVCTDREAGRGYNAFYIEVLYDRWLRLKSLQSESSKHLGFNKSPRFKQNHTGFCVVYETGCGGGRLHFDGLKTDSLFGNVLTNKCMLKSRIMRYASSFCVFSKPHRLQCCLKSV